MRSIFLTLVIALTSVVSDAQALSGKLRADGTEFVLRLSDGRILRGADVVGMQLVVQHLGEAVTIRIEDVSEASKAAGGAVFLYRASVHEPDGSSHDLCLPDAAGLRAGFPIPDGKGWFSFSCTSGVEAKCVLMGYRPWEQHPSGASMRDLHKACIHLMRADYGGDDQPTTRDGTPIDVEDRFGIQTFDHVDGMTFEAAWGPDGALCVARPRIAGNIALETLAKRYPHLEQALGPEACTRERMAGDGRVLLLNRSHPN
ncbi:MAG: hypothetical protein K0Q80_192 [Microvirga sp.]|nr:hypothetical protein [Microvirga sp.]